MIKFNGILYHSLFLLLLILYASFKVPAQELNRTQLDSLYTQFIKLRTAAAEVVQISSGEIDSGNVKCGFGLSTRIRLNFKNFSSSQQKELSKILQRPSSDASMVSPSGFFRIHYNTAGVDIPGYDPNLTAEENVMQVAIAADSAYNFEVGFLGYPAPPQDNGEGGDNRYDIYITSIRDYGSTEPENSLGNQTYTSFIKIHPDYANFYTKGLSAMRVTMAHEIHHAIQIGNYTFDRYDQDAFFYEMTSTAMEEFVFDSVNDYYAYMPLYFQNTDRSFNSNNGYNLAIWDLYLKERFGFDIIKRQWELMPEMRALDAINTSIFERTSSFQKEFNTFGLWTYFTDERYLKGAEQGFAFEEGSSYPRLFPLIQQSFTPHEDIFNLSLYSASNTFLRILNGLDTLVILITNSDVNQAKVDPNVRINFTYGLYDHSIEGSFIITNLYFKNTETSDPFSWTTAEILNDSVIIHPVLVEENAPAVFPLPFIYGKNGDFIRFPVYNPRNMSVDFNVYTIGMELVYAGPMILNPFNEIGGYVVSWAPLDNKNGRLASGIYLYVIKSGDEILKGKFVVFNE